MEEAISIGKLRRIGGSFTVTIPINVIRENNLNEDELVEIKIRKKRINGFGILKEISSFSREDRAKGQLEK